MARILLANEFGDGFGHARRLLAVARELAARGHECLFALRDPVATWPVLGGSSFPILQAPYVVPLQREAWQDRTIAAYGDILAGMGFDDPERLQAMLAAWDSLLALLNPDLVIADFAPLLCLTLYPARALLLLGNGFTLPPSHLPQFPKLREADPLVREDTLLASIALVQRRRGQPFLPSLPALLSAQGHFITTLPELDPYAVLREGRSASPLHPLPPSVPVAEATDDYFAYLSANYAGTAMVIEALARSGLRGSIYLRDADAAARESWRRRGLQIHENPVDLPAAVAGAALTIHHGGPATMETALAIGRRQLLVPRHFEQTLYARAALGLRVAVAMKPHGKFDQRHAAAALRVIAGDATAAQAASDFADELAARGPTLASLPAVLDACAALLH